MLDTDVLVEKAMEIVNKLFEISPELSMTDLRQLFQGIYDDQSPFSNLGISLEGLSEQDHRNVTAFVIIEASNRIQKQKKRSQAFRRSRQLLGSFLTPKQRREMQRNGQITVIGSAGGRYRLHPQTGSCKGLKRHGKRWFAVKSYCLHDPENILPPADVSLGQMLLLLQDEPKFLATANVKDLRSSTLWNGTWLRRLNQARRERAAERERLGEPDTGSGLNGREVQEVVAGITRLAS